jgi:hypothetical protein
METQTHTPEPWNTVSDPIMGTLIRKEGLILAKMRKLEGINHEANAARIVACVNACADMENPRFEIEGLRLIQKAHADLTANSIIEREELLKVLRLMADGFESGKITQVHYDAVSDAIEKFGTN